MGGSLGNWLAERSVLANVNISAPREDPTPVVGLYDPSAL